MSCMTLISFAILMNGAASPFFFAERGIRQGCPLSPLLFLLVAECLSRFIIKARVDGNFKGISISPGLSISNLLFVDDILIFYDGSRRSLHWLVEGIKLFHSATGMLINEGKSSVSWANLSLVEIRVLSSYFNFQCNELDAGVKYLGFFFKPNNYQKCDWMWLFSKIEKKLSSWSHRWLSRAGRLVMVKVVLEAMPVYWRGLTWIPKGILEKIRRLCFSFLWSGSADRRTMPWVGSEKIALPKALGGWGLKNIFLFAKALEPGRVLRSMRLFRSGGGLGGIGNTKQPLSLSAGVYGSQGTPLLLTDPWLPLWKPLLRRLAFWLFSQIQTHLRKVELSPHKLLTIRFLGDILKGLPVEIRRCVVGVLSFSLLWKILYSSREAFAWAQTIMWSCGHYDCF